MKISFIIMELRGIGDGIIISARCMDVCVCACARVCVISKITMFTNVQR